MLREIVEGKKNWRSVNDLVIEFNLDKSDIIQASKKLGYTQRPSRDDSPILNKAKRDGFVKLTSYKESGIMTVYSDEAVKNIMKEIGV